jgi:hypothetical protein
MALKHALRNEANGWPPQNEFSELMRTAQSVPIEIIKWYIKQQILCTTKSSLKDSSRSRFSKSAL